MKRQQPGRPLQCLWPLSALTSPIPWLGAPIKPCPAPAGTAETVFMSSLATLLAGKSQAHLAGLGDHSMGIQKEPVFALNAEVAQSAHLAPSSYPKAHIPQQLLPLILERTESFCPATMISVAFQRCHGGNSLQPGAAAMMGVAEEWCSPQTAGSSYVFRKSEGTSLPLPSMGPA